MTKRMKLTGAGPGQETTMDFESCRFDFRIDSKNGLTPSKRKKAERKGANNFTLFKCKICGSLFDSRPALLEHKMAHNKFKCVFCDARFARQSWMMDHVAVVHGATDPALLNKRKRKSSAPAPRKLLPKPVEDVDLSSTMIISESDSEPPSPIMSPPVVALDAPGLLPAIPSPGQQPGVPQPAAGRSSDVFLPSTIPELLPMSLPLTSLPVSPLTINTMIPPASLHGLATPQLLTPHLLPAFQPPASLPPLVPCTNSASSDSVPCIYINVPILLSSGDSGTVVTESLPQISAVSMTTPPATVTSAYPTPMSTPSLLPVNPFIKKDFPPISPVVNDQSIFKSPIQEMEPDPKTVAQESILRPRFPGPFDSKDMVPMTLEVPLPGLMHPTSAAMLMPVVNDDQTEALDFSIKPTKKELLQDPKKVFNLGIQDPSATFGNDDMDTVVDLSRKPTPDSPTKPDDDRLVMLQEYNAPSKTKTLSEPSEAPEASPKTGTKRSSAFLDKMVQRLWKSKITKVDDDSKDASPDAREAETLESNSSFGRVYVLNQLPEQVAAYAPGTVEGSNIMNLANSPPADTKPTISDKVLQSAAANIANVVLADTKPATQMSDKGFCSIKFHTCRVCKQLFYSAEEMWEHAVTHQEIHKYKCSKCPYVTACHRELINHRHTTHGHDMQKDGRHICTFPGCMKSYSEWRYLRDHQKTHLQGEERVYTSPTNSQQGDSPGKGRLMCDFTGCYKTFKEWRHLKVHQTLHTGEKPLSCQLCSYACRHRSSMNWHMKSKHGLDKMKTQGNRTVYVDSSRRVICGWSDEANREVNYLKESPGEMDIKPKLEDLRSMSEYSSIMDESRPASTDNSQYDVKDIKVPLSQLDVSTSVSMTSSRPPSCAPSENPSERSLMDDPHLLMLKMQAAKAGTFGMNMSVQIEDLSPKEQIVGEDGRITSKLSDASDKMSEMLTIDTSQDYGDGSELYSPACTQSTVSSTSLSSSEASSLVRSESNRFVMTPVACSNVGMDSSEHQASMMKFKLKYLVAPKYYPCKVCNENFDSATKMWEHRIENHQEGLRFFCDNCRFDSATMADLQSHMLSTHGKEMGGHKNFICFICGKGYATKTGLNQHLLRHSEDGPPQFECPYENCVSKVHSKCALKNHIRRIHLKVPAKYLCPEEGCQRRFESNSALKNHMILHTAERPLSCEYPGCDKSFRESKHLKVHQMQHTDEKPIKCDVCDYSCRQRNSMNWHMKSKHNREKVVSLDGRTSYIPIKEEII